MNRVMQGHKKIVTVLDIGTHKVACFISEVDSAGKFHVIGIGHHLAKGFRAGIITDAREAETSIRCCVGAAEDMAETQIESVVVSLSGTHLESNNVSVEMSITGEEVNECDITELLREGCALVNESNRSIIHCFVTEYHLDGQGGVEYPINMYGSLLGANLHIISADNAIMKNLDGCIGRCHLDVKEFISSPHTAAIGCLEADEMELGVTLIDMGAGQTGVSVFSGGHNIYSVSIPVGGHHVTNDVATGLHTSIVSAERLKTLHGSAISAPQDNQTMIDIPPISDEDGIGELNSVPRSSLIGIIRPRLEEIFEIIADRLGSSGLGVKAGRNVVLTGGASQLIGTRDLASRVLGGKQVRLGKPHIITGLADSVSGPGFSSIVGMVRYLENRPLEDFLLSNNKNSEGIIEYLKKLWKNIKDSL